MERSSVWHRSSEAIAVADRWAKHANSWIGAPFFSDLVHDDPHDFPVALRDENRPVEVADAEPADWGVKSGEVLNLIRHQPVVDVSQETPCERRFDRQREDFRPVEGTNVSQIRAIRCGG